MLTEQTQVGGDFFFVRGDFFVGGFVGDGCGFFFFFFVVVVFAFLGAGAAATGAVESEEEDRHRFSIDKDDKEVTEGEDTAGQRPHSSMSTEPQRGLPGRPFNSFSSSFKRANSTSTSWSMVSDTNAIKISSPRLVW